MNLLGHLIVIQLFSNIIMKKVSSHLPCQLKRKAVEEFPKSKFYLMRQMIGMKLEQSINLINILVSLLVTDPKLLPRDKTETPTNSRLIVMTNWAAMTSD